MQTRLALKLSSQSVKALVMTKSCPPSPIADMKASAADSKSDHVNDII